MNILYGLIAVAAVIAIVVWLFVQYVGNSRIEARVAARTPFVLTELTKQSATFMTKIEFVNVGKQCATVMDCYVRHLLAYEQFDGVRVSSKAELESAPREDDYFEAVLITPHKSIQVLLQVTLTARKDDDIKVALAGMVDLPLDLVYQYVTRDPWAITKQRVTLTETEIAALVGIAEAEK